MWCSMVLPGIVCSQMVTKWYGIVWYGMAAYGYGMIGYWCSIYNEQIYRPSAHKSQQYKGLTCNEPIYRTICTRVPTIYPVRENFNCGLTDSRTDKSAFLYQNRPSFADRLRKSAIELEYKTPVYLLMASRLLCGQTDEQADGHLYIINYRRTETSVT